MYPYGKYFLSLIIIVPAISNASVLTFEDVPYQATGAVNTDGYVLNLYPSSFIFNTSMGGIEQRPSNGSNYILHISGVSGGAGGLGDTPVNLSLVNGGGFYFLGFDAVEGFNWATIGGADVARDFATKAIIATGVRVDGSIVSESFTLKNDLNSFQRLTFSSYSPWVDFGSLKSLSFSASGDFAVDNINVAAVPELETYTMLIAGLGLIGAVSKRRKTKQV